VTQLCAVLAWAPLVLGHGAARVGLACCAAMAAVGGVHGLGAVNPVAGDLAKPVVSWVVLLAVGCIHGFGAVLDVLEAEALTFFPSLTVPHIK
jgi:hypothetical protein